MSAEAGRGGVTIVATAQGRQAVIALLPGRPGPNRFEARVTDVGGAPVAAREATVRWSLPEAGIEPVRTAATAPLPGVYAADDLNLPRTGRWVLRLDLLVDDFTELTFEGEAVIGEPREYGETGHHHTGEIRQP